MDNEALEKARSGCEHDYKLDEEIGMCCRLCGHVGTEIKDVSAPFVSEALNNLQMHNVYVTSLVNDCISWFGLNRQNIRNGQWRLSSSKKMT